MQDRKDDNPIGFRKEENAVGEPADQGATNAAMYFRKGLWLFAYSFKSAVNLGQELSA